MLVSLLVFILVLSVLVFVHELGHFAVAKWVGMRVDEFGIGFPPRLFTYTKGETRYCLNLLPLGGYVKIHGESAQEEDNDKRSFQNKSVWARIAVIVAGVVMNMLFAIVVLSVAFSVGFVSLGQQLEKTPGAVVEKSDVYTVQVLPDSPASKVLEPGQIIRKITNTTTGEVTTITSAAQLQSYTKDKQAAGQRDLSLTLEQDGETKNVPVTLAETGVPLGVAVDVLNQVRVPFWQAPVAAVKEVGFILQVTWEALSDFGRQLVQVKLHEDVSGPVGIYRATDSATQQGIVAVVFLMVALSVNLALLNILPIPALDGGKLLFLLIELVVRKRVLSLEIENAITIAGMAALLGLISLITLRDVGLF